MSDQKGSGRIATLGVFIIDQYEVRDEHGAAVVLPEESIGGGGVFAICAARHFLPPQQCMLIVDQAPDMPPAFRDQLLGWGDGSIVWRDRADGRGMARAVNVYSGHAIGEGHQSFRYITAPQQLTLLDIALLSSLSRTDTSDAERESAPEGQGQEQGHGQQDLPEWVHVVVRLPRAVEITREAALFAKHGVQTVDGGTVAAGWRPKLAWEPLGVQPMDKDELEQWIQAARACEIVSPNLLEAQTVLASAVQHLGSYDGPIVQSADPASTQRPAASAGLNELSRAARQLYDLVHHTCLPIAGDTANKSTIVIVRAGALGSYTISPLANEPDSRLEFHTPAYWRSGEQGRVVDPTGGGNGFMGGLCAGMVLAEGDVREACLYGAVAASFAIEQRGLPVYTSLSPTADPARISDTAQTKALWNGDEPMRRLDELKQRLGQLAGTKSITSSGKA